MRTATPAVTQYVRRRRRRSGARRDEPPRASRASARRHQRAQRQLRHQPAAGEQDAALALALRRRAGRRWPSCVLLGPRGVHPDHRHRLLPEAGREALRAHARRCRPAAAASSTATARCWPPACRRRRCWVDPEGLRGRRRAAQGAGAAAGHDAGRARRSGSTAARNFAWLRRQVDEPLCEQVKALGLQGRAPGARVQAPVPRGRGGGARGRLHQHRGPAARKASSWRFQTQLQGRDGRAPWSRTGSAAWSRTSATRSTRWTAATSSCRSTPRCSSSPTSACATRWPSTSAKAGSVVVLDVQHRRGAGAGQLPELRPRRPRATCSGAQLRNRALTDTFEPGSTMKPFIAALALETGRVTPDTRDPHRAGQHHHQPARRSATRTRTAC